MLVLFIRSPIYTRIFSPEEYGLFALVNITFTYLSTLSFSWILSCSLRYYNKYNNTGKITTYQSVVNLLMLFAGIFLILIAGTWYIFVSSELTKRLLIYGTVFFVSEKVLQTALTPARLQKRANFVNIIKISNAILAFGILLFLTFIRDLRIESFFIAPAIINSIYIIALVLFQQINLKIQIKSISSVDIKRFVNYGIASLGLAFGLFLLLSSDRYIIALFYSDKEVGIYNQVYNLAQISLIAIVNVFQAATNPILFDHLEKKPQQSKTTLSIYAYMGSYIYLPLAVVGSLFANELAIIMLGEEFRVAWRILPWIFASTYLNGMIHFLTIRMKFLNNLKPLITGSFIAAGINIILNLILLPKFNYEIAAITTLLAYAFLMLFFYIKSDAKIFENEVFYKSYIKLFISLVLLSGVLIFLRLYVYKGGTLIISFYEITLYLILFLLLTRRINPFLLKEQRKS